MFFCVVFIWFKCACSAFFATDLLLLTMWKLQPRIILLFYKTNKNYHLFAHDLIWGKNYSISRYLKAFHMGNIFFVCGKPFIFLMLYYCKNIEWKSMRFRFPRINAFYSWHFLAINPDRKTIYSLFDMNLLWLHHLYRQRSIDSVHLNWIYALTNQEINQC